MKTYRLGSSELVFAPGVVRWAMAHFTFKKDQQKLVDVIVGAWPGVPTEAATALLSKQVPFTVEDDVVVFEA